MDGGSGKESIRESLEEGRKVLQSMLYFFVFLALLYVATNLPGYPSVRTAVLKHLEAQLGMVRYQQLESVVCTCFTYLDRAQLWILTWLFQTVLSYLLSRGVGPASSPGEATVQGTALTIPYSLNGQAYKLTVPYARRRDQTLQFQTVRQEGVAPLPHHPCVDFVASVRQHGVEEIRVLDSDGDLIAFASGEEIPEIPRRPYTKITPDMLVAMHV